MRRLLAGLAVVTGLWGAESIVWTQKTPTGVTGASDIPGSNGYLALAFDPSANKAVLYGVPPGSTGIYSTNFFFYDAVLTKTQRLFGYDSMVNACPADKAATFPGDRHPYGHVAEAASISKMFVWGGVNQSCNGSTVSTNGTNIVTLTGTGVSRDFHSSWVGETVVIDGTTYTVTQFDSITQIRVNTTIASGTGRFLVLTNPPPNNQYMWSTPLPLTTTSTWTRTTVTNYPALIDGTTAWDPTHEVLISLGSAGGSVKTYMFCPAIGGVLTSGQTTAGCTAQNDWKLVHDFSTQGGVYPKGYNGPYGMMHWIPSIGKMLLYGGQDTGGVVSNETWVYDVVAKTWTKKCVTACTPPPAMTYYASYYPQAPVVYNSNNGKVYYHHKDTGSVGDYEYDPVADTWTLMSSTGTGPSGAGGTLTGYSSGVYDPVNNRIITYGSGAWWEGQLSGVSSVTGQFRVLGTWPSGNIKWLEVCGVVGSLTAGGTATVTLNHASISGGIALEVREALGGATGVARTDEPFCMGVPIADSYGISTTTGFTLSGTTAVTNTNMATDGTTISVDTGTGGGLFVVKKANTNIIDSVVVGGTTVVATSTAATRGLVLLGPDPAAGTTQGKVTCSPDTGGTACTTVYSSANDSSSTCSVEKNGPIAAVVKCTGTHKSSGGSPYMQFTTRTYFWRGKTGVKVTSVLRNATLNTAATPSADRGTGAFNTAFKGFKSYELRVGANITGTLSYTIAGHAGNQTGTVSTAGGTDEVYVYQGTSLYLWRYGDCSTACLDSYVDSGATGGYQIIKNASTLASGTDAVNNALPGWADISNASGVGVSVGFPYMSAYFPKSLEFDSGGNDVRLGIWPRQNTVPVYQAWPQWSVYDLYLNFHATSVTATNAQNEFLRFQHPLIARPSSRAYINAAGVFPFPINDPAQEDAYYLARETVSNPAVSGYCAGTTDCSGDYSSANGKLEAPRTYNWGAGGGSNQEEFRWANLLKFYQRGYTGRFLNSAFFYRYQIQKAWPMADGFTWRSRPNYWDVNYETNYFGQPMLWSAPKAFTVLNESQTFVDWSDLQQYYHYHWWGITDYYMMTGDETVKDAIEPMKDWFMNPNTMQGLRNGTATNAKNLEAFGILRAASIELAASAMFSRYLASVGDTSSATTVLSQGALNYTSLIRPDGCLSGYPAGCVAPPVTNNDEDDPVGVNRKRGWPLSYGGRGNSWCNTGGTTYRSLTAFQGGMLVYGLLLHRWVQGSGWTYYKESLDLAYGVGQWATTELYSDNGSNDWYDSTTSGWYNGFRYGAFADKSGNCPAGTATVPGVTQVVPGLNGGEDVDANYSGINNATVWMNFYVQYLVTGSSSWARKFNLALDRLVGTGSDAPDKGGWPMALLIDAIQNPTSTPAQTVTPSISHLGAGTYRLTWTPLGGTVGHRVKWSANNIVPLASTIGYDAMQGDFTYTLTGGSSGYNPATYDNWFAATDGGDPTCSTTCTIDVATGNTGLTAGNFSVIAYASGTGGFSGLNIGGKVSFGGKTGVH